MTNSLHPTWTIRAARTDEAETLTAIAVQSKSYWHYSAEQIAAWRADLTITAAMITRDTIQVAQVGNDIAGFYVLQPQSSDWVLDAFWVAPSHMGRGIGRALLEHAQHAARVGGAKTITIDADPNAEAFYRACGAKTVRELAAPLEGMSNRIRPQMMLTVSA